MKYLRNAKPRGLKRTALPDSDGEPKPKRKPFQQSPDVQIYPSPTIPAGEDESSWKRNIKAMALECKKAAPDLRNLDHLMERSFSFRRRAILETPVPTISLFETYPALKRPDMVS